MSKMRYIPPVVGHVTRERPKVDCDPDSNETYETRFVPVGDGLYRRETVMETYQVKVVRLPCGCAAPDDEIEVGALHGFASYDVSCPKCRKKARISDAVGVELEGWLANPPRSGWVNL